MLFTIFETKFVRSVQTAKGRKESGTSLNLDQESSSITSISSPSLKSSRDFASVSSAVRSIPRRSAERGMEGIRSPLETQQQQQMAEEKSSEEKSKNPSKKSSRSLLSSLSPSLSSLSLHRRSRLRTVASSIPEVHFIGDIRKGDDFNGSSITCKWSIDWGETWSLLSGAQKGQTQYATRSDDTGCVWNHPIDVHFTTANMKGWPRIILQVWNLDNYGRTSLIGYGFSHLPTTAGMQVIDVKCWRPKGTMGEECKTFFLGTSVHLTRDSLIFDEAWENRHRLVTVSSGTVSIHIATIIRHFNQHAVE